MICNFVVMKCGYRRNHFTKLNFLCFNSLLGIRIVKYLNINAVHQNYVGIDSDKNPYFLSIVSQDSGNKCVPLYRAMLFRKQVISIVVSYLYVFLLYLSSSIGSGDPVIQLVLNWVLSQPIGWWAAQIIIKKIFAAICHRINDGKEQKKKIEINLFWSTWNYWHPLSRLLSQIELSYDKVMAFFCAFYRNLCSDEKRSENGINLQHADYWSWQLSFIEICTHEERQSSLAMNDPRSFHSVP